METYELVVLLHPDLEIDLEKPIKKIEGLIKDQQGKIVKKDEWGKRKLSYTIKKQDYAIYVYFELDMPKENLAKLDSILNITDESIRHLLVKHVEAPEKDEKSEKQTQTQETKEQEEA